MARRSITLAALFLSVSALLPSHEGIAAPASPGASPDKIIDQAHTLLDKGSYNEAIAKLKPAVATSTNAQVKARILAMLAVLSAKAGNIQQLHQYAAEIDKLAPKPATTDPVVLEARGLVQLHTGHVEEARTLFEQSLSLYQSNQQHQIPVIIDMAHLAKQQQLIGVADDQYEKATQTIQQVFGDKVKLLVDILREQATMLRSVDGRKNDVDRLEAQARSIEATIEPTKTTVAVATIKPVTSSAFIKAMQAGDASLTAGRYKEAEASFLTAVSEAEKQDDARRTSLLGALRKLAQSYQGQQNWPEASKVLTRAADLMEADKDVAPSDLGQVLSQLATIYQVTKDSRCLPTMRRALKLKEQGGSTGASLEQDIMMLGVLEMNAKNFSEAEASFNRLIPMAQSRGDREAEGRYLSLLGSLYMQQGRMNEGMSIIRRASGMMQR